MLIATLLKPEHRAQLPGLHLVNPSASCQEIPHPFLSRESQDCGRAWDGDGVSGSVNLFALASGVEESFTGKGVCILCDGFSHKEIVVFESCG